MAYFPQIYLPGEVMKHIGGFTPRLASWNANDHPDQIRLKAYLDDLRKRIGDIPKQENLYIALRVDVQDERKLIRHHDVENYLTPLFGSKWFDHRQFPLVIGAKHVGNGSTLTIGTMQLQDANTLEQSWHHLSMNVGSSPTSQAWKQRLNEFAEQANPGIIPADQHIEFHMAYRCSSRRNWVSLWKPTGDALSPILGYSGKNKYNPHDDRITSIHFHRFYDESVGNDVYVGLWWRPVPMNGSESLQETL